MVCDKLPFSRQEPWDHRGDNRQLCDCAPQPIREEGGPDPKGQKSQPDGRQNNHSCYGIIARPLRAFLPHRRPWNRHDIAV